MKGSVRYLWYPANLGTNGEDLVISTTSVNRLISILKKWFKHCKSTFGADRVTLLFLIDKRGALFSTYLQICEDTQQNAWTFIDHSMLFSPQVLSILMLLNYHFLFFQGYFYDCSNTLNNALWGNKSAFWENEYCFYLFTVALSQCWHNTLGDWIGEGSKVLF